MKFAAFEFDATSRTFHKRAIATPALANGEVMVRVKMCTICGSDLHSFSGRRTVPSRCVMGHEIVGEVFDWGGAKSPVDEQCNPLNVGDRVTWAMAVGCGDCFFCRSGVGQKCESVFKYGHEPGSEKPTGGFSEFCFLKPGTPIFPVPDQLPNEVACPANCATATVCAAMRLIKETHRIAGSTVFITGAGMLGLTAVAQMKELGASQIVVAETNLARRDHAKQLGATHAFEPGDLKELAVVNELTNGRGADIAVDFAGVLPAVQSCVQATRVGGCVMLAGSVFPMNELQISPETIVRKMLTIRGIHNYLPEDLSSAIAFLASTKTRELLGSLVAKNFELSELGTAFEFATNNQPIRVSISSTPR